MDDHLQALICLGKQAPPYRFALVFWHAKLFMHEREYVFSAQVIAC